MLHPDISLLTQKSVDQYNILNIQLTVITEKHYRCIPLHGHSAPVQQMHQFSDSPVMSLYRRMGFLRMHTKMMPLCIQICQMYKHHIRSVSPDRIIHGSLYKIVQGRLSNTVSEAAELPVQGQLIPQCAIGRRCHDLIRPPVVGKNLRKIPCNIRLRRHRP